MAEQDYVRLAAACHCGKPVKVLLGPGRPPKYCGDHTRKSVQKEHRVTTCEGCSAQIKLGAGGRITKLCQSCKRRPTRKQMECPACRGFFTPRSKTQKACSKECGRRARLGREARVLRTMNCTQCDQSFETMDRKAMYCSKRCKTTGWKTANPERWQELNQPRLCAYFAKNCDDCGKADGKRRDWSVCEGCVRSRTLQVARRASRAIAEAQHKAAAREMDCVECGLVFCPLYGSSNARLCAPCGIARKRAQRKAAKQLRVALKRGAQGGEKFADEDVLERDGWRCQLCGIDTPKRLRGTHEHNAPEVDHCDPVARGGKHTMANTKCLCRSCNCWKGARTMEEALAALAD